MKSYHHFLPPLHVLRVANLVNSSTASATDSAGILSFPSAHWAPWLVSKPFHANSAPRPHFPLIKNGPSSARFSTTNLSGHHISPLKQYNSVSTQHFLLFPRSLGRFYGLLERRFRGVGAVAGDSRVDTHARALKCTLHHRGWGGLCSW